MFESVANLLHVAALIFSAVQASADILVVTPRGLMREASLEVMRVLCLGSFWLAAVCSPGGVGSGRSVRFEISAVPPDTKNPKWNFI